MVHRKLLKKFQILDFGLQICLKVICNPYLFMLPKANWKEKVLFFVGRRRGFMVEGNSMLPTLKNGDVVLINPQAKLNKGDIVLANHPYKKSVKILKRIKEFTESGEPFLIGDNAGESTDSRTFGAVPLKCVLGKVSCLLKTND